MPCLATSPPTQRVKRESAPFFSVFRDSRRSELSPVVSIKAAVLDGLGDMFGCYGF